MHCCKLSNPSPDLGQQYNQLALLYQKAGSLLNPPKQHVCVLSLPITLDKLDTASTDASTDASSAASALCYSVHVPESRLPTIASGVFGKAPLSPIAAFIINNIGDKFVAVIETTCDAAALKSICPSHQPLIAFPVGNGKIINGTISDLTIIDGLTPEIILNILTHCKRHIIVGSLLGWWGAVISGAELCIYTNPWMPGNCQLKFADVSSVAPTKWQAVEWTWGQAAYFDHVYYINLDRRPDRRTHMEQQLAKYHMSATRMPAIDGKSMQWQAKYGYQSDYWNNGALAYCLSYRDIIVKAIQNDYENVLIMDDDAVLTDLPDAPWLQTLDAAWSELPEEWHMLYLAANHGYPVPTQKPTLENRHSKHLYRLSGSMGSHAIILNRKCFKYVLYYLAAPYAPLDSFFSFYQQFFPCYITSPGLASQLPGHSDIIDKKVDYTKDWGIDYINWA